MAFIIDKALFFNQAGIHFSADFSVDDFRLREIIGFDGNKSVWLYFDRIK